MSKLMLGLTVSMLATGCLWERSAKVDKRLTRLQLGVNARRVAMPAPASTMPVRATNGFARTIEPTEPAENVEMMSGATGSMQFTMRQTRNIYAGGEVEAGPMQRHGSYFGAMHGVIGAETRSSRGSISVELVGGRQWLRYEMGAGDVPVNILEPRARGQYALSDQVSIGGVIGASLLGQGWMSGVYLGVYSHTLGGK